MAGKSKKKEIKVAEWEDRLASPHEHPQSICTRGTFLTEN